MVKTVGILLVILGASGTGFSMAFSVRQTISMVQQLLSAMEVMKNEISYRRTPLPELMRLLELQSRGCVAEFFGRLATELSQRQERSVDTIVRRQVAAVRAFPPPVRQILVQLGGGLGQYDTEGQLRSIDLAVLRLRTLLDQYRNEQQSRIRSYCTLGICGGLAIAILAL